MGSRDWVSVSKAASLGIVWRLSRTPTILLSKAYVTRLMSVMLARQEIPKHAGNKFDKITAQK